MMYMYVYMYAERCIFSSHDERVQREGFWAHYGALGGSSGKGPIMAACIVPISSSS